MLLLMWICSRRRTATATTTAAAGCTTALGLIGRSGCGDPKCRLEEKKHQERSPSSCGDTLMLLLELV